MSTREHKYRGKQLNNGEWVYGYYLGPIEMDNSHEICDINSISGVRLEVDPDAVGEYTGRKDKNENEIYEGDILSISESTRFEVMWNAETASFYGRSSTYESTHLYAAHMAVVIGNRFDNPELLEATT